MSTNKIFIQFFFFFKGREDEWIYIIKNIKLLLIRVLKIFYLSLEDPREIFHNDLYILLFN